MPLIACPECGKQISNAAAQCIGCGHPMTTVATVAGPRYTPAVTSGGIDKLRREQATAAGVICPNCGGENTAKLSLVHAEGTSRLSGSTSSTGIGVAGGHMGLGITSGSVNAIQQSQLSKALAPPTEKSTIGVKIGAAIVSWFLLIVGLNVWVPVFPGALDWLVSSVAAIGIGAAMPEGDAGRWNREEYPKLKRKWERSLLCRRCGSIFEGAQ